MSKATLFLAGALLCSSAVFAQQATPKTDPAQQSPQAQTPAEQQSQQSQMPQSDAQAGTASSSKSGLSADQKAELKALKEKVRTECKADKTSEGCKQAKSDLKSKKQEYGMTGAHHKGHKGAAADTSKTPTS